MDVPYGLRLAQLEKVKGELKALCAMWYDPCYRGGGGRYEELKEMSEKFLRNLSDSCG